MQTKTLSGASGIFNLAARSKSNRLTSAFALALVLIFAALLSILSEEAADPSHRFTLPFREVQPRSPSTNIGRGSRKVPVIAPHHKSSRMEGSAGRVLWPRPAAKPQQPVPTGTSVTDGYEKTAPRGSVSGNASNAKDDAFTNQEGAGRQFGPLGFGGGASPYPQFSGFPGRNADFATSGPALCAAGTSDLCGGNPRFSDLAQGPGSQNDLGALWDDFPTQDPFGPDVLATAASIDGENPATSTETPQLIGKRPAEVPEPPTAILMFGALLSWWVIGTGSGLRRSSVRQKAERRPYAIPAGRRLEF